MIIHYIATADDTGCTTDSDILEPPAKRPKAGD